MANPQTFVHIWRALNEHYPYRLRDVPDEKSDSLMQSYQQFLADIPDAQLEAAALSWLASGKFFPAVSDLRDLAFQMGNPDRLSPEEAWGKVRQAILDAGVYREPEFEDGLITRAVKIMGWRNLCMSENEPADRAHFFKVYAALDLRQERELKMLPEVRRLIGQLTARRSLAALHAPRVEVLPVGESKTDERGG
jgi:hypothetical protein